MSLNDNEKSADLAAQFAMLAGLNEPEAMIAALRKACERKAQGLITPNERKRWLSLANALALAEATIDASQAPERAKQQQIAPDAPQAPAEPPSAA
jgi:hypothetical protein